MVWLLWEIQSATMNWVQVLRWHHWKLVSPSLWFCSQEGFPSMIAMLAQRLQESLLSADAWPSLNQSLWFWLLQPVWAWGCVISPTWPRGHRGCGGGGSNSPQECCAGWGRMDVQAATSPAGLLALPTGHRSGPPWVMNTQNMVPSLWVWSSTWRDSLPIPTCCFYPTHHRHRDDNTQQNFHICRHFSPPWNSWESLLSNSVSEPSPKERHLQERIEMTGADPRARLPGPKADSITGCVALDKLLYLSGLQFSHM